MFLNLNNEVNNVSFGGLGGYGGLGAATGLAGELSSMFFTSPCKFYYAVNDSDWSEGVDIDLINIKKAPLNLAVSMPPETDCSPELLMSRAAYYTNWKSVPKDAIFLKSTTPKNETK
jgi:hypothetical protein